MKNFSGSRTLTYTEVHSTFMALCKEFDYDVCLEDSEKVACDIFVDHTGNEHLIFMDAARKDRRDEVKLSLKTINDSLYGCGFRASRRKTSISRNLRRIFKKEVPDRVSVLTVASVLRYFTQFEDLELMSELTFWIDSGCYN